MKYEARDIRRFSVSRMTLLVALIFFFGNNGTATAQIKPKCTPTVCYCGLLCYLGPEHVKRQLAYDRLNDWVKKQRKPVHQEINNQTDLKNLHENNVVNLALNWHFVDLGKIGNYVAMKNAVFAFETDAGDCVRVVLAYHKLNSAIPLPDYREFYKCLGRSTAVRDIIFQHKEFRTARKFADERMKRVNNYYARYAAKSQPRNVTQETLKQWYNEGYHELVDYWNKSKGPSTE